MIFDTNTLGYKLVTGQLKKHSEQLNKYVAGLLDTDGWIGFEFTQGKAYVRMGLRQAATVDGDFQMLRAVQKHYQLGTISYGFQANDVSFCSWRLSTKHANMLFGLVGKHMRIKQSHFKNILEFDTTQGDLKEFSRLSRENTGWLKRPKHLSYAYVAGLLDGDGCYRIRKKEGKITTMCVKAAINEEFILLKLQEDFGGSINDH